jgi:protein-S-isoprenylcysteine O-methyltransferase Ste14
MLVNRFFSATVRIQTDRGHSVVSSGPYRFMRHPGYLGAILFQLATPLFLGSWWGILPAVLSLPVHVTRTGLEDRTLRRELVGYRAYSQTVRFRLLPGIW